MNPRIKLLAEQAGYDWQWDTQIDFGHKEMEKLAQLIVWECADIAKHHVMNISTYSDAEFVEEQIKEHFGVEE
jgi:hypothetical protein